MDPNAGNPQTGGYFGNTHHGQDISPFRPYYEAPGGAHDGSLQHETYPTQPAMDVPGYGNNVQQEDDGSLDKGRSTTPKTLPMVLAKYMRVQNKPVTEDELYEEVQKVYKDLRKPDGTKYTGNLHRAVRGSLCSTGLFEKLEDATWTLKEEQTQIYEKRLMDKAAKQEAEKSKKRKHRDDGMEEGNERQRRYSRKSSTPGVRSKRQHRKEAIIEMVCSFSENLRDQQNWASCFQNPFKSFRGDEKEDDVWKKLGNDKFVFMLQIYTFLGDLISNRHIVAEALAKEKAAAKAEKAGKKRVQNTEEKATNQKNQAATITPQQLSAVGKIVTSLQENILKLNTRLNTIEEVITGQWGPLDQRNQ